MHGFWMHLKAFFLRVLRSTYNVWCTPPYAFEMQFNESGPTYAVGP